MRIKRILSLILTLSIICTMLAIPAFAETTGDLRGDCKILVHDTMPIKVPYMLYDLEGNAATDVTYALNGDANIGTYAKIDSASGILYVSPKAKGKSFSITATGTGSAGTTVNDSVQVEVLSTVYCTDFDDETGTIVTNSMFKTNTAQVVDDGNGGKAAFVKATGTAEMALELDLPENISLDNYTVNGEYKVTLGDKKTDLFNKTENVYCYDITSGNYLLYLYLSDTATTNNQMLGRITSATKDDGNKAFIALLYTAPNSGAWGSATEATFDKFVPFNMVYTTDLSEKEQYPRKLVTAFYNESGTALNKSTRAADYSDIAKLCFGGYIDNLEVYSGTIASSAEFDSEYVIEGESTIARAYSGTIANINYELKANTESVTVPDSGITWSLAENYEGVSVEENTGVLSVNGGCAGGVITLVANINGEQAAKKLITVMDKVTTYGYIYDTSRIHNDFNTQGDAGSEIVNRPSKSNSDETTLRIFNSSINAFGKSLVKSETVNGQVNKYASAAGYVFYSSTGKGTNLRFRPSYMSSEYSGYSLIGADKITLEGKYMIESATTENMELYDRWSVIAATNVADSPTDMFLDIRYGKINNDIAAIYSYMDGNGNGLSSEGKNIAVKEIDKWFDLRVEFDNNQKTFDLYIDDVLVMDNEKANITQYAGFGVGCAVDDIILYTGSKAVDVKKANDVYAFADGELKDVSFAQKIEYAEAKEGSSFAAAIMETGDYDGAMIITALYSDSNQLIDIKYGEVEKTSAGVSVGYSAVSGDVPKGGYAKVFVWNLEGLTPVK